MCRSIKKLRHAGHAPTEQELYEAALQFVRKVSGYRVPSQKNQPAFDQAVLEVAAATREMFRQWDTIDGPPSSVHRHPSVPKGARS